MGIQSAENAENTELGIPSSSALKDSLRFINGDIKANREFYGDKKYNSRCKEASNNLEAYEKKHPNADWIFPYLVMLHFFKEWQDGNPLEGRRYCRAGMDANNIKACSLWIYVCKNPPEEFVGIDKITEKADEGDVEAMCAKVRLSIFGAAGKLDPSPHDAKKYNDKLNQRGDHRYDHLVDCICSI